MMLGTTSKVAVVESSESVKAQVVQFSHVRQAGSIGASRKFLTGLVVCNLVVAVDVCSVADSPALSVGF